MYVYLKMPLSKTLQSKYDILGKLLFSYPQSDEKINFLSLISLFTAEVQKMYSAAKPKDKVGEKQIANSVESGKIQQL